MKKREILQEVLQEIKPSKKESQLIKESLDEFLRKIKKQIQKKKIKTEIFIGGSFAKKTLIRKEKYDIDVFLRFDKKYADAEISKITQKILKSAKTKFAKVHGSRDYFRIKTKNKLYFEVVPVTKVSTPQKARNITDLSYSHVKYINKKIKSQKLLEEIMLAKKFCQANNCYGAESYIKGFSGYSIELLVYHYKGFENFLKKISKIKTKEIIDIEKLHKTKPNVLRDLNSSKLNSPIILIDPTFKQRNALAALSEETLKQLQKSAKEFLKKPSKEFFHQKTINLKEIQEKAKEQKSEFLLLKIKTSKQPGDIAGSKLYKFYKYLSEEISRFFELQNSGFNYDDKKSAKIFFVVQNKKQIILEGPFKGDKKNVECFKKKHKHTFTQKGKIYAKQNINFTLKEFIKKFKTKNKKQIKSMGIKKLKFT